MVALAWAFIQCDVAWGPPEGGMRDERRHRRNPKNRARPVVVRDERLRFTLRVQRKPGDAAAVTAALTSMSLGAILFDFDGTLVDARESAWELFAETNSQFGLGVDTREAFFLIFKGNFYEAFDRLCPDQDKAAAAKDHFMSLLRLRYEPRLIPGIVDIVRALSPSYTLAVVSTNTMAVIRRSLESAGIATCFSHVFSGDVEQSKTESIRRFLADQSYGSLRQCSPSYVDSNRAELGPDNVYLVTDTVGDIAEACRVGIRVIGVAWGMHGQQNLLDAGAERVALWPQELVSWFGEWVTHGVACSCDECASRAKSCCTTSAGAGEHGAAPAACGTQRQLVRADIRQQASSRLTVATADAESTPHVARQSKGDTELLLAIAGTMSRN
jgi:phosphoglycolate phosphatase